LVASVDNFLAASMTSFPVKSDRLLQLQFGLTISLSTNVGAVFVNRPGWILNFAVEASNVKTFQYREQLYLENTVPAKKKKYISCIKMIFKNYSMQILLLLIVWLSLYFMLFHN